MEKIYIIGVNEDGVRGISDFAKEKIYQADVVVGGKRHISLLKEIINTDDLIFIGADIEKVLDEIEDRLKMGKKVVVLNSGDPLFYGFGKNAIERFGKEICEIIPNISSVQLAFSKIKENWDDAKIISIHSKKNPIERFLKDILENEKLCFLTSGKDDPKKIARFLIENDIKVKDFWVLEDLGSEKEKVRNFTSLYDVDKEDFSPLNIVIILKDKKPIEFSFGIPEENFSFFKISCGLITKGEIRAVVLSKLSLTDESIVWDIGGGSGSVSIECAKLATRGKIFCVEKRKDLIPIIKENIEKFKTYNVEVVEGSAPEVLSKLPDPTSVFIGGGGEKIEDILSVCLERKTLKSIVATFVVPSHFVRAVDFLEREKINFDAFFFNILKRKKIDGFDKLDPYTSVFLVHAYMK